MGFYPLVWHKIWSWLDIRYCPDFMKGSNYVLQRVTANESSHFRRTQRRDMGVMMFKLFSKWKWAYVRCLKVKRISPSLAKNFVCAQYSKVGERAVDGYTYVSLAIKIFNIVAPGWFRRFLQKNSSFWLLYQSPSSSADYARELFSGSNGSASLVGCTQKKFFLGGAGFLWVTS